MDWEYLLLRGKSSLEVSAYCGLLLGSVLRLGGGANTQSPLVSVP